MRKYIIYLSILFISLANSAVATYNNAYKPYYLDKNRASIKTTDYTKDYYHENKTIRPYVGLELFNIQLNFSQQDGYALERPSTYFKDSALGFAGFAGFRFHKNFGLEGFYKHSFNEKKVTNIVTEDNANYDVTGSTLVSAYGIDILAYLPLNNQIDLLASVGIGQYKIETEFKDQVSITTGSYYLYNNVISSKNYDTAAIRIGAGLQYNMKEAVYLRGMIRYVKMSDDDYIKSLTEISLGMFYLF